MKKIIFVLFSFLFISGYAYSQVSLGWIKKDTNTIGFPSDNCNNDIIVDNNNNIYTIAHMKGDSTNTVLKISKLSDNGSLIWDRTRTTGGNIVSFGNFFVKLLTSNSFAVVYNFNDTNGYSRVGVMIYNFSGFLLYDIYYSSSDFENYDIKGVCTDKQGNIFATGSVFAQSDSYTYCATVKFDSSGTMKWIKRNDIKSWGNRICTDSLGNIYICGSSDSAYSNKSYTLTIKYDNNGNLIWKSVFGFANGTTSGLDIANAITLDDSLNVIIGGTAFYPSSYVALIVKYSNDGQRKWNRIYSSQSGVLEITNDSRGNIYASCYSEINTNRVLKYDKYGNLSSDFANSNLSFGTIKFFKKNFIYALGTKRISGQYLLSFAILDTNLNVLNSYEVAPDTSSSRQWGNLSFDNNGCVFISGNYLYENIMHNVNAFFVIKLKQSLGIINLSNNISENFSLFQNYPNPFNPATNIKYQIANNSFVELKIYSILGKEITTLVNEKQKPGTYEVTFDGSGLSSGIYFYRLITEGFSETRKMILLK